MNSAGKLLRNRPISIVAGGIIALGASLYLLADAHTRAFAFLPLIGFTLWLSRLHFTNARDTLDDYAAQRDMRHIVNPDDYDLTGSLLQPADENHFVEELNGYIHEFPLHLYGIQTYARDSQGRVRNIIPQIVVKVSTDMSLMNVLAECLNKKGASDSTAWCRNILLHPRRYNELTPEGNFSRYYQLKVDPGEETLALQIFEPDVMQSLIDQPQRYTFQLSGNNVYIYDPGFHFDAKSLDRLFIFTQVVVQSAVRESQKAKVTQEEARPKDNSRIPVVIFMINAFILFSLFCGVIFITFALIVLISSPNLPTLVPLLSVGIIALVAGAAASTIGRAVTR